MKTTLGAWVGAALTAGALLTAMASGASAQSVRSQCSSDYAAAKAGNTLSGQSWTDFYAACKAKLAAAPAAAPAAVAAPATPAAPAAPAVAAAPAAPAPKAAAPTGASEFSTEAAAKAHCPTDTVVWLNTKSHKYHFEGRRAYGKTKQGAYICEADAKAAGGVPAKGEAPK